MNALNQAASVKVDRPMEISAARVVLGEEKLIEQYLYLVSRVVDAVMLHLPAHISADDIYSIGVTGLVAAVRKFDPDKGYTFSVYAAMRIRGAILDELRRMDWCSRRGRARIRKLKETVGELEQELGRSPSDKEICAKLGLTAKEYAQWQKETQPVTFLALDYRTEGTDGHASELHELLADENEVSPIAEMEREELLKLLSQRLFRLPGIQKKVLAMYYFEEMTQKEIARVFDLTESRICQIRWEAIRSMRWWLSYYRDR